MNFLKINHNKINTSNGSNGEGPEVAGKGGKLTILSITRSANISGVNCAFNRISTN